MAAGRNVAAALLTFAGGAAAVALFRRRASGTGERVDLYYSDGSMVSLDAKTPETQRLVTLARDALRP